MRIILTRHMKRYQGRSARNNARVKRMVADIEEVAKHFPELNGRTLKVGYTSRDGTASKHLMKIAIQPGGKVYSYALIAHELTHLIQGSAGIPSGEKACDLWTMARHPLFNEIPPSYLDIPQRIIDDWDAYRDLIREKAIRAIAMRQEGLRRYIRWFENEVARLHRRSSPANARNEAKRFPD